MHLAWCCVLCQGFASAFAGGSVDWASVTDMIEKALLMHTYSSTASVNLILFVLFPLITLHYSSTGRCHAIIWNPHLGILSLLQWICVLAWMSPLSHCILTADDSICILYSTGIFQQAHWGEVCNVWRLCIEVNCFSQSPCSLHLLACCDCCDHKPQDCPLWLPLPLLFYQQMIMISTALSLPLLHFPVSLASFVRGGLLLPWWNWWCQERVRIHCWGYALHLPW